MGSMSQHRLESQWKRGGRGHSDAMDLVKDLRASGLEDNELRKQLGQHGYKPVQIFQLVTALKKSEGSKAPLDGSTLTTTNAATSARPASVPMAGTTLSLPTPFRNVGNSCYINATLQALFGGTTIRHEILCSVPHGRQVLGVVIRHKQSRSQCALRT